MDFYDIEDGKLGGAVQRGVRRARIRRAVAGVCAALTLILCATTIGAIASPAFAAQLSKLPLIDNIVNSFRPNDGMRTALDEGYVEPLDIVANNDHFELVIDGILAGDDGFTLIYRYRWLKPPEEAGLTEVDNSALDEQFIYLIAPRCDGMGRGSGSFSIADAEGWRECSYAFEGTFSKGEIELHFDSRYDRAFEDGYKYGLDVKIPYNPSGLESRTIWIHRSLGKYELIRAEVPPNTDTRFFYTMAREDDSPQDKMFFSDATGQLWHSMYSNSAPSDGGRRMEYERVFENLYFAKAPLTLHIVDGNQPAIANDLSEEYRITLSKDGQPIAPEGIEVVNLQPTETGYVVSVRLTGYGPNERGIITNEHDATMFFVESPDQVFTFHMEKAWGELKLSATMYPEDSELSLRVE